MRVDGLDIPIDGIPEQDIFAGPEIDAVALLGRDTTGLSPALRVEVGEKVKLGQALFVDRRNPDILFTSPGAGVVSGINRGAKRALLSVVVRLEEGDAERFASWPAAALSGLPRSEVVKTLCASGLWTAFRTRPYSKVPSPATMPHSIFITATDSNPLAAYPEIIIAEQSEAFINGQTVLSHLTEGALYLCKNPQADLPVSEAAEITVAEFAGSHPSGLAGTHIHFLDPVSDNKTVWHLNYQDVIAIGHLFTSGQLPTARVISLAGPAVERPRLLRTRLGADVSALIRDELKKGNSRIISGSVLSGREAQEPENFLGRYHNQISALPEIPVTEQPAERQVSSETFSIYGPKRAAKLGKKGLRLTTEMNGERAAMIPMGGFERVMPLDILPAQMLRALLVGDTDMAQALGCLELDEEDLSLCTFVCPGKLEYGSLLRAALDRIEREG